MNENAPGSQRTERPDPSLDEARELKRRASERCGHDIERIMQEIRAIQQHRRVVPVPKDFVRGQDTAA